MGPAKKRGHPQIAVTEDVLERWRLAMQRYNVRRSKSIIASDAECTQTENNVSEASHTDAAWPLIPPTSSTQDEEPAEGGKGNKDPNSASGGGTNQGITVSVHLLPRELTHNYHYLLWQPEALNTVGTTRYALTTSAPKPVHLFA
ncbi:hypothetical protein AgCh_039539 [Apium graveolens]